MYKTKSAWIQIEIGFKAILPGLGSLDRELKNLNPDWDSRKKSVNSSSDQTCYYGTSGIQIQGKRVASDSCEFEILSLDSVIIYNQFEKILIKAGELVSQIELQPVCN